MFVVEIDLLKHINLIFTAFQNQLLSLWAQQLAGLRIRKTRQLIFQCYHGDLFLIYIGMIVDCTSSVSAGSYVRSENFFTYPSDCFLSTLNRIKIRLRRHTGYRKC